MGDMRDIKTILSGMERNARDSWLLYFSYRHPTELGMALIWIRFKTKKRMWFFM